MVDKATEAHTFGCTDILVDITGQWANAIQRYTCDGKINHDENREKSVLSALVVAAKMIHASEPSPPKTIIMEPHSDYPQAPTKL